MNRVILIVDDETGFLHSAALSLKLAGYSCVETLSDPSEVLPRLDRGGVDLLFLDIIMPNVSGMQLLTETQQKHPDVTVVMITALNDAKTALSCMRLGAFDYLVKPFEENELLNVVRKVFSNRDAQELSSSLRRSVLESRLHTMEYFSAINTNHPVLLSAFRYAEALAPTDFPILVTGETGTGKELMARAIHKASGRKGEFVCVNAGGIDDTVLNDTLFGHVKGAFTGADRDRSGLIESAARGTLFLDEIGDLKPESQIKLLRLLQEGVYYPIGSDRAKRSTARVIAATHRNLKQLIDKGHFRLDLFYRLQAHELHLPPLRERPSDIPLLVHRFASDAAERIKKETPNIPQDIFVLLANHSWPGNVRELQGLIYDAVSRSSGKTISLDVIKDKICADTQMVGKEQVAITADNETYNIRPALFPGPLPTVEEAEMQLIQEALRRTDGNKTLAAEMLGLTRQTLIRKLK
ncbi:MAG: sigma-54-dependent Fis family transcriptional regulator [Fibrobacteres bacterium]|nr:sigma-54-dependent Fis family transcriptional regulator [Fibrobacterota bacterium]